MTQAHIEATLALSKQIAKILDEEQVTPALSLAAWDKVHSAIAAALASAFLDGAKTLLNLPHRMQTGSGSLQ